MAEITNLRQIIRFFRDDDDAQMAWSRWMGRGAMRLGLPEDVTLMDLCNVLSIPVKEEWGPGYCYLGFIHEMPPVSVSHPVDNFPHDLVGAIRRSLARTMDHMEISKGIELAVVDFCRIRRTMESATHVKLHLQSFVLYCKTVFDPSRGWSILTPPDVDDEDSGFREITYAGEHATKKMLLDALDLWVLMECDDQEEYQTRTRYYCEELDAANQIIFRYGLQIQPQTIENMREEFYSIIESERYTCLGNRAVGCVYSCLNMGWDGIGPWRK